ncbi:MAG TPA: hypothetical protein VFJ92_15820 [Gemmatimonadales bacterium]|nr:hypothetical protein [Gemmatimonadales bacterium]
MRVPPWLIATMLLVLPTISLAQAVAPPGWQLGILLESVRFSRGLVDAASPSDIAAGLRPSAGTALALTLARSGAVWRGELVAGWAGMRPQADNESVAVLDRTTHLTRMRLGAALERSLFGIGAASLALGAGPTLDWWRVVGEDRVRVGGAALVALRLPLGTWMLENRLGLGVSESPFVPEDVGETYETRTLLSVTLGLAVRAPL